MRGGTSRGGEFASEEVGAGQSRHCGPGEETGRQAGPPGPSLGRWKEGARGGPLTTSGWDQR